MNTEDTRFSIPRKPVPNQPRYSAGRNGYASELDFPLQPVRAQAQTAPIISPHSSQYKQLPAAVEEEHKGVRAHVKYNGSESQSRDPRRRSIQAIAWNHPLAIVAFCTIFASMLAGVLLLQHFSDKENGFSIGRSTNSYTWKYGPTAVLTIVISLWRQVDHNFKIEAPWQPIGGDSGYRSAEKTLLLDYTSPILPTALIVSIKNRHWRVTASMSVFVLLKATVLFSTGLLVLQDTNVTTQEVPMSLDVGGNDTLAWRTNNMDSPDYIEEYYGIIGKGLPYPSRTSAQAAYQELSGRNSFPPGARLKAEVLAFYPYLDCEIATIGHNVTASSGYLAFDFLSDSCYGNIGGDVFQICYPSMTNCTPLSYHGNVLNLDCPTFGGAPSYDDEQPGYINSLLVALVAIESHQTFAPGNLSHITSHSQSVLWTSGAVCKSSYSIEKAVLFVNVDHPKISGGTSISSPLTHTGDTISGYSFSNLTLEVSRLFAAGDQEITGGLPPSTEAISYSDLNAWFDFGMLLAGDTEFTSFRNASFLVDISARVFQGLASTWVGAWLSFPAHLSTTGEYSVEVQRLHIQKSSVWGMSVSLTLTIVLSLLLLAVPYREDRPHHSDMMMSRTQLAHGSKTLVPLLSNCGHHSNKQIEDRVRRSKFTLVSKLFSNWYFEGKNTAMLDTNRQLDSPPTVEHATNWWTPVSASRVFTAIAIILPISIIIVLEILQRISDANQGICDTLLSPAVAQAFVSLIPAAAMFGIAAMYSSTEWAMRVFAPYYAMKKAAAAFKNINYSPLGELPPVVIVKSVARRQFAISAIAVSAVLGSVLTIIVSGLYSIQSTPKPYPILVHTIDQLNSTWNGAADLGGGNTFSLIQYHNASFPKGTYDELTFPFFTLGDSREVSQVLNSTTPTHVDVVMPVTRASLNCTFVPQGSMRYKLNPAVLTEGDSYASYTAPTANVTIVTDLPLGCQFSSGIWHNVSHVRLESSISMPDKVTGPIWGAQMMQVGPPGTEVPVGGVRDSYPDYPSFPAHCPSIAFIAGKFGNDTNTDDKSVLLCSQFQEQVPGTLSFLVPGLSLDTTRPPQLEESNATTIANIQYDIARLFEFRLEASEVGSIGVDDFYAAVVYYLGIPAQELVGQNNQERFLDTTQHLYRQYMAQILNDAARVDSVVKDSSGTKIGTALNATIYDPNRLRVLQNNISKIILQAVLAAMVILLVVAYAMIDMRRTLAHNPSTIAGSLSLLLGSSLVDQVGLAINGGATEEQVAVRMGDVKLGLGWWRRHADVAAEYGRIEGLGQDRPVRFGVDTIVR